ncbi:hypothetical protein [Paractinoplanes globisporus]|uniref:Uncharacterized protein n=1 Tax=Paractinoplanes globisporus TaxID=113565 RepID=A0ABW6WL64_9ACTN|nr:hypothetical protein [Actinoplanes globisporus]
MDTVAPGTVVTAPAVPNRVVAQADPGVTQAVLGNAGNAATQRAAAPGRIADDELVRILENQPDLAGSVVDLFHFTSLRDLESAAPKSYKIVRERLVARFGAGKIDGLYANDARIVRLLAFNAAVAAKLDEFKDYYRATNQPAAEQEIAAVVGEYEWDYAGMASVWVEAGEAGLRIREFFATGRPDETVAVLVAVADAKQAEQIRLDALAAEAEKWKGKLVASKEVMFWSDDDVHLEELLYPRQGTEEKPEAVAWARMSGYACGVVQIKQRFYLFKLDHQYDRSDIFLVEQWEEARTEVVPVPSTPADITLTTSDGYVLKATGERFFGGTQARKPEEHLAADEKILAEQGGDLGHAEAVALFRQMTLDLLLVNLAAAERRVREQLAVVYGVEWNMIDLVRNTQPGYWKRTLKPKTPVGKEVQETAATLRQLMIDATDFAASTGNRDLTEDERVEIEFTLEQIGRIQAENPMAAMMVISHRDKDATGPAEEDQFEDKAAPGGPQDAAGRVADELWERLDNIDQVRRHFLREPDAVLDLEPLHDQILGGFTEFQRFFIHLAVAGHSLRELAKAIGLGVLQLGLVITGFLTAGLTALAASGAATMLGVHGTVEAFENARLLGAMSKMDLKGGFQLASPEQAATARTWAYIGLGLTILDVGGFVAAGRLAARLSHAAAMPDVVAALGSGERNLASVARDLGMSERTLARQLETLTGTAREELLARIRQVAGFRIGGFAQSPTLKWVPNPGGEVRTIDQAVALARRRGVIIPEDINFVGVAQDTLPPNAFAEYAQLGRPTSAGQMISWEQFYNRFQQIPVRLSNGVLNSDEAIVAVIGHEMHELNGLRKIFDANDGFMRADQLYRAIAPGFKGNLHDQAWDIADKLVKAMRDGG